MHTISCLFLNIIQYTPVLKQSPICIHNDFSKSHNDFSGSSDISQSAVVTEELFMKWMVVLASKTDD